MQLKRVHDGEGRFPYVQVLRAGERQNFWPKLIKKGLQEGWLVKEKDKIILHGMTHDWIYKIVNGPGSIVDGQEIKVYQCELDGSLLTKATEKVKRLWQILSTI